ncbi:MAG: glycosyltransferase family 2 protein [Acidimicrobiales bacterium]
MSDLAAFAVLWALGWVLLWRVPVPGQVQAGAARPAVSVVVPARDEAANLPVLLGSLVPQLGSADEVLVVDDHSCDGTGEVALAAGGGGGGGGGGPPPPRPEGWAGKQWACHTGAAAATNEVLVFLDADTRLEPGGLDRIVGLAARGGLTSIQPFHLVPRWQERLAAFFNVVGMMGTAACTPLGTRIQPRGAFGPCLASTAADYRASGGHEGARASVLDDVAIARAYRGAGLAVRVLGGRGTISFRMYPRGLRDLVAGFTKNMASAAIAVRPPAAVAVAGWLAACAAPLVLAGRVPGPVAVACYVAVVLQLVVHLRRLGTFGPVVALAYPVALAVFLAVFARSLVVTYVVGRVSWKGRSVPTR